MFFLAEILLDASDIFLDRLGLVGSSLSWALLALLAVGLVSRARSPSRLGLDATLVLDLVGDSS